MGAPDELGPWLGRVMITKTPPQSPLMTRHRETRQEVSELGMPGCLGNIGNRNTSPRIKGSKSRTCQKLGIFNYPLLIFVGFVGIFIGHILPLAEDIILPGPFAQLTIGVPLTPLSANNGPLALRPGSHVMNSPGYEVVTWTTWT